MFQIFGILAGHTALIAFWGICGVFVGFHSGAGGIVIPSPGGSQTLMIGKVLWDEFFQP